MTHEEQMQLANTVILLKELINQNPLGDELLRIAYIALREHIGKTLQKDIDQLSPRQRAKYVEYLNKMSYRLYE
tara:strand:+ start:3563 stop:3784 length:222 start_codon:yes stop_codon:yes gene_type:complete